jgi:hypothetical protein
MNYKETRRYFVGEIEETENFNICGVVASGGEVRFPKPSINNISKRVFNSWDDCETWIKNLEENMEFKANKKMTKVLTGVNKKAVKITDADWDLMTGFMVNSDSFDKEDFKLYELWLAHNFVDRDGERFNKDVLKSFNKSMVGKSLLYGHEWGPPGEGRFFKSKIVKTTVDETIELIGMHPNKNIRAHLEEIEAKDGSIQWLVPTVYMLTDKENEIRKIDAGIVSDVSIGFRCPECLPVKSPDDENAILYYEYKNTAQKESEALEGSFVFLGSQYGAQTRKSASEGPKTAKELLDLFNETFKENKTLNETEIKEIQDKIDAITKSDDSKVNQKKEVKCMNLTIKGIGDPIVLDVDDMEKSIKEAQVLIEEKLNNVETELGEAKTAKEAAETKLKDISIALGNENLTVDQAKAILLEAQNYKTNLVEEAVKMGVLVKLISDDKADDRRQSFAKLSIDEIQDRLNEYKEIHKERNPIDGLLSEGKEVEKEVNLDPTASTAYDLD